MERLTYRSQQTGKAKCTNICANVMCYGMCDGCVVGEVASKLCEYEETGLTPEETAGLWIYGSVIPPDNDFEKTIQTVEDALGFKLFVWQKNYLAYGEFRKMGVTTAQILRELLDVSGTPIDYRRRAESEREKFYRGELQKIKKKLDAAGIPTRKVLFSERGKCLQENKEG